MSEPGKLRKLIRDPDQCVWTFTGECQVCHSECWDLGSLAEGILIAEWAWERKGAMIERAVENCPTGALEVKVI